MNLVDKYIQEIRDNVELSDMEARFIKTKMINMAREYAERRLKLLKEKE